VNLASRDEKVLAALVERCLACEAVAGKGDLLSQTNLVPSSGRDLALVEPPNAAEYRPTKGADDRFPCSPEPRKRGSAPGDRKKFREANLTLAGQTDVNVYSKHLHLIHL
jgi:hypothetical protein